MTNIYKTASSLSDAIESMIDALGFIADELKSIHDGATNSDESTSVSRPYHEEPTEEEPRRVVSCAYRNNRDVPASLTTAPIRKQSANRYDTARIKRASDAFYETFDGLIQTLSNMDNPIGHDEHKAFYEKYRRRWSRDEIEELWRMLESGTTITDICIDLLRPKSGVFKAAWKLGYGFERHTGRPYRLDEDAGRIHDGDDTER